MTSVSLPVRLAQGICARAFFFVLWYSVSASQEHSRKLPRADKASLSRSSNKTQPKSTQPEPLAKPIDPKNPNVGKVPDEEETDPDDSKAANDAKTNQNKGDKLGGDAAAGSSEGAQDYTGPSVLSRGFNVVHPSLSNQNRFRPFIGVNAIYDSGIAGSL